MEIGEAFRVLALRRIAVTSIGAHRAATDFWWRYWFFEAELVGRELSSWCSLRRPTSTSETTADGSMSRHSAMYSSSAPSRAR